MKHPVNIVSICTLLATTTLLHAEEKLNLSLDWKPGKIYQQQIEVSQVVGVPRHGEAKAKTNLQMALKVSKGGLQVSFDGLKILLDPPAPVKYQAFDSALPQEGNHEIAQFYDQLQRQTPKLLLDDRGRVREVTGLDHLTAQNPIVGRFLGKEQMVNLMQQGWLAALPAHPVSKGDSWPYQMKFPTPVGALSVQGTYTLGSHAERGGRNLVEIQLMGDVQGDFTKADPNEKDEEILKVQAMMMMMGVKVKVGTMKGSLWYDPTVKMLVSSEVDTNIRLSVEKYPENGQPAEIPIQQSMTLKLSE
jgi:hypothetical protein